jgi:RNA polymerase sigma factor (sigma-70 family)
VNPQADISNAKHSADIILQELRQAVSQAYRCHRHRPRPGEVEEISQQIFSRLIEDNHRRLRSFDGERSSLQTWLHAIAKNHVSRHLRREGRIGSLADIKLDALLSPPPQEDACLSSERKSLLQAAASELSPRERQMLELLCQDGLKDTERAKTLGIKPDSFRVLKHQLIKKLRGLVGGGGRAIRA